MKNYVSVLMIFLLALMFSGCGDNDNSGNTDPKTKTVVTLNPETLDMDISANAQIVATTVPANTDLTWTSSNEAVATVGRENGWLTSFSVVGSTVITATAKDGGYATCNVTVNLPTSNYAIVEGETLVHYSPKLVGVNHFGTNQGTTNDDGSYTFNGTAGAWSGGGAQYAFPTPRAADTWLLSNYDLVEMHLIVTDGSVTVGVKKSGNNVDLKPYPDASNAIAFNTTTNSGKFTYKTVIGEAGSGIGFQRNTGGPATVGIEKVVFSKGTMRTISFTGGEHTGMMPIAPIKIPDGRIVNFGGSYAMPERPTWAEHTFVRWYNETDQKDFDQTAAITKDLTLSAVWIEGVPEPVDMGLNLNPDTWGTLPTNAANSSGSPAWIWPSAYAETSYENGVLTLEFSGDNRQRAIIPLSSEQIEELMATSESGVTFRIVGTVKGENGIESEAEFRCHLGNPSGTSNWNGTNTGAQGPLKNHLVEYAGFSENKNATTLSWFMIQAMYMRNGSDGAQSGFPKVIITIESITIDIGNTQ